MTDSSDRRGGHFTSRTRADTHNEDGGVALHDVEPSMDISHRHVSGTYGDPSSPLLHEFEASSGSNAKANHGVKLSAGATIFTPGGSIGRPSSTATKADGSKTPIHYLNRDAEDEQPPGPTIVTSHHPIVDAPKEHAHDKKSIQRPIGTRTDARLSTVNPFTTDVVPSELYGTRTHYIKLAGLTSKDLGDDSTLGLMMADFGWQAKIAHLKLAKDIDGKHFVYIFCFDDFRDSAISYQEAEMVETKWKVGYSNQMEYANARPVNKDTRHANTTYYDGQVIFAVNFDAPTSEFREEFIANDIGMMIKTVAETFGELWAFEAVNSLWPDVKFRAEYFKISAAKKATAEATTRNPIKNGKWSIVAHEMNEQYVLHADTLNTVQNEMASMHLVSTPYRQVNRSDINDSNGVSPTGRTAWVRDKDGNHIPVRGPNVVAKVGAIPIGVPIAHAVGASRHSLSSESSPHTPAHVMQKPFASSSSGSWASGYGSRQQSASHNSDTSPIMSPQTVDIDKILAGHDVRTTVMLRNIPNRMNCWELKQKLDCSSKGRYDFSYLRIDFEKGTNVGYAFVNFADPEDIVPFVKMFVGNRWLSSNKREVELSYATVQGYDCLIEKFRNSAIMEEYVDYRPKLWYTTDTAPSPELVGTEAPFPGPNNFSKRQRSHDNAGQIGLYAPRSARLSREATRHSQFDRGTPAQLQEDAYYNHTPPVQHREYYDITSPRDPINPPPQFGVPAHSPGMYGRPFDMNPPYANRHLDNADPFYNSGYNNGHRGFGVPASHIRIEGSRKVGANSKEVHGAGLVGGGPVQRSGEMSKLVEGDEYDAHLAATTAEGFNNTPGPFHYPSGY